MSSSDPAAAAAPIVLRPDWPDALNTEAIQRWKAVAEAGAPPLPEADARTAGRVMALSDFVFRALRKDPALVGGLARGPGPRPPEDCARRVAAAAAGCPDEPALMAALRRLRQREMVRIAYRDLSGAAALEETLAALSALADACIAQASAVLHRWMAERFGQPLDDAGAPQEMVVVAMGKLGARELNFSSDIDIILAYPSPGRTDGASAVSCEEFFTRLARRLIRVLGAATPEGFVFRVDPRLRPYGDSGPMVMNFDQMEDYYQSQGREWERYAWIKARPVTGGEARSAELMARLKPFIYRRYLDYGAIEGLREMKAMIHREVKKKGMRHDIKLGAGGIREIEFFGQIFQLMRGGVTPALQARPIQRVLHRLAELEFIPEAAAGELLAAYRFLRNTEHRLQMAADQQTHRLPDDDPRRRRLAAAMGLPSWDDFSGVLAHHRTRVHAHFQQLLAPEAAADGDTGGFDAVWQAPAGDPDVLGRLSAAGYAAPEAAVKRLALHRKDPRTRALSREGRSRLDRLMPKVIEAAAEGSRPDTALDRIVELLAAIQQRTNYLSLLIENPSVLEHLTRLAGVSPWIMAFLSRHPVLLDELLDPRTLYTPPRREDVAAEIDRRLSDLDPDDLESQIETLCILKNVNTLRVAAADITGTLPLMRASDHLTDIAEAVVEAVLALAWRHVVATHGRPSASIDGRPLTPGFAVVGYGKLGGIELGYGSDLDMVFLHAADSGYTTGADRGLDNAQFYARLGQRMIHILTTHTRAGRLYEVDMRLRPSGAGGILVSHVDAFAEYQEKEAWTWEHQALVRARPIAGDDALHQRFADIRHAVIARRRDPETLRREVVDMRQKMRREAFTPTEGRFDVKQGNGGIVDIEFLVQYLVLRHAHRHPALTRWSDNVRQLEALTSSGVIPLGIASFLKQAFLTYRSAVHRLNLEDLPAAVSMERFAELRREVSRIWGEVMLG